MKNNLFKNFKSLKEVEEGKDKTLNVSDIQKVDNVSVNEMDMEKKTKENDQVKVSASETTRRERKSPGFNMEEKEKEALSVSDINKSKLNYAKKNDTNIAKKSFTVFLKESSLEFIKDFVFYKVTQERQIFYNQSNALIESIDLIKKNYKDIQERPDFIREQEKSKKGGRKRNSDDVYSATTSCYIPIEYWDFVKDVTYSNVIQGQMYFKDWDFIEEGILALKAKYKSLISPRPDYIREEENLRGRRTSK